MTQISNKSEKYKNTNRTQNNVKVGLSYIMKFLF